MAAMPFVVSLPHQPPILSSGPQPRMNGLRQGARRDKALRLCGGPGGLSGGSAAGRQPRRPGLEGDSCEHIRHWRARRAWSRAPATAQDTGLSATGGCAVVPILPAAIPVVEVTIGGKGPYRFAIDTGAQGPRADQHRAGRGARAAQGRRSRHPGAGRHRGDAPGLRRARSLGRHGQLQEPRPRRAVDGARAGGASGTAFSATSCSQLLPLTLDYGNARARFGGPGCPRACRSASTAASRSCRSRSPASASRSTSTAATAPAALFLDEAAARALPLAGEPVERGRARTSFGDFAIMEAPLAVSVTVGGAPLPVQAIGWPSPRPGGNLGSRGMAGHERDDRRRVGAGAGRALGHGRRAVPPDQPSAACFSAASRSSSARLFFSAAVLSWPQAASMSRPRGVRTGARDAGLEHDLGEAPDPLGARAFVGRAGPGVERDQVDLGGQLVAA